MSEGVARPLRVSYRSVVMKETSTRRRLLRTVGVAGATAFSGCLFGGSGGSTNASDDTATASPGRSEQPSEYTPASELSPPDSIDSWINDANGPDLFPARGDPPVVEILVGVWENGRLAFRPSFLEIPTETTVRWRWLGESGSHNVVAIDGTFDSGRPVAQKGVLYEHFFEEPGEHAYVCEPHRREGMKGAVLVRDVSTSEATGIDQWLSSTSNYEGEVADRTDETMPTVTVGADAGLQDPAFDPPAIRITAGATVTWVCAGNDGVYDIVFENAEISSGRIEGPDGIFRHTFTDPGTYLYTSRFHEAIGTKGAVAVV